MTLKTPFVRVTPEDVMPGFDPEEAPDPGEHWDPDELAPSEEWNRQRMLWTRVKAYQTLHGAKFLPPHYCDAYEMPELARVWADKIMSGEPALPLVLYGQVGVGKTHGACAAAVYLAAFWDHQFYTETPAVVFAQASRLLSELKAFSSAQKREDRLHEVTHAKVLIIDDLTRFQPSDFDMETLGQILDTRTGAGLPTVITINEDAIETLDTKVPMFLASRLQAGQMVRILGADRRLA